MIFNKRSIISTLAAALLAVPVAMACTSALVPSGKSASGRPLMWKHRDAGVLGNFLQITHADSLGSHAYLALHNEGDTDLTEAWMGFNDAGFAIMNTASYNVPQYAGPEDKEGVVMAAALARCSSVDDFLCLLEEWPKPSGVMANFGVMDSTGRMAYVEAWDYEYKLFPVADTVMVRTNYSVGFPPEGGLGRERYCNVYDLMGEAFAIGEITPAHFTDSLSRTFYSSATGIDYTDGKHGLAPDNGTMIPRYISTASIVIEGGPHPRMWAVLGFPPCGIVEQADLDNVPATLLPQPGAKACLSSQRANAAKEKLTVRKRGKRFFKLKK